MDKFHTSVLLQETIHYLNITYGEKYIDATVGGAGHTLEIIKHGGKVLGIDVDEEAIRYVKEGVAYRSLHAQEHNSLHLASGNFKDIKKVAEENGFTNVAGILFDLGVSSAQLDRKDRGFSFMQDAPLDMRMDKSLNVTAADLVNGLTKGELYELFTKYGEETRTNAIVNNIIRFREVKKIETTTELAHIVEKVYAKKGKIHPATKVFQALRIAVNDELNSLKDALPQAIELLQTNGRLVVISFHSLEDRIVKQAFLQFEQQGKGKILTKHPVSSSVHEINENRRSRSAKLRAFEKTYH